MIETIEEIKSFGEKYQKLHKINIMEDRLIGYINETYTLPTVIQLKNEKLCSHQNFDTDRLKELYKDWIEKSIPIKVYINPEEYPEYFL